MALARPAALVERQQPASDQRQEQAAEQKPTDTAREVQPSLMEQQRPAEQAERVYPWGEQFTWRAETGTIQSYQHNETHRHIHIDGPSGQFYDSDRNPISRDAALGHAMPAGHTHSHQDSPAQNIVSPGLSQSQPSSDDNQGFSL